MNKRGNEKQFLMKNDKKQHKFAIFLNYLLHNDFFFVKIIFVDAMRV